LRQLAGDLPVKYPRLWLRVRPGQAVKTHAYMQTGQEESKFGFSPEEARQAVRLCLEHNLPIEGLHFHLGSHFHDPTPLEAAIDTVLKLAANLRDEIGWVPKTLSPGGGWGVAYTEEDLPQPSIEAYVSFIAGKLVAGCQKLGLPLPYLQLEPGRSLAARAGVAVYRVGAVKHTARRRWLLLDGGMADNPRPALYKARYSALPVVDVERSYRGRAWLAGPTCESCDILIKNLPMPDIQVGELIAVPVSGAYQLSMSSNYNGARKPAVIWLDEAGAHLILRRETLEDLINRDEEPCI
jgi:diaminopimelate decarboxylase